MIICIFTLILADFYVPFLYVGPLPKDHNIHHPYKPHVVEFLPALPYVVKMIDGEGRFFLSDLTSGKPTDLTVLNEPIFSKNDFINDLYKLMALGANGPV